MELDEALRVFKDTFAPRRDGKGSITQAIFVGATLQKKGGKQTVTVTRRVRVRGQWVEVSEALVVTVPRGVKRQQLLRLAGKGDEREDGTFGDLFLEIFVDPDAKPLPQKTVTGSLHPDRWKWAMVLGILAFFGVIWIVIAFDTPERLPDGAPCRIQRDCKSDFCWREHVSEDGYCTEHCGPDSACPSGFGCRLYDERTPARGGICTR